jgi:hypothetical protein
MQRLYNGLGYEHLAFLVGQNLLAPDYNISISIYQPTLSIKIRDTP